MFFTSNGLRLFALEAGSGDPPLVFLHANGANHTGWHHQIAHFSKRHRVIALDVRGQGESEADPKGDYTQETLAEDLLAGMDALGISKAVLIGWSVGALTATRFAANHPERSLAVVLVDNAPAGDKIGVDPRPMQEYIKLLEEDFYGKGTEVYINRWFPEEGPEIEELKRWSQAVCRRIGRDPVLGIRVAGAPPDRLDLLSRLTVPTLILQGGASPGSGRPMGEYLQSIVPNSRLYVFEGKGHAFNLTAPDEFNRVLEGFLSELDGRQAWRRLV